MARQCAQGDLLSERTLCRLREEEKATNDKRNL